MSEPKRYTDLQVWEALHFAGSTNGWIRWEDYARLKAEVERLRKAGDEVAQRYLTAYQIDLRNGPHTPQSVVEWNAAKEGKQS